MRYKKANIKERLSYKCSICWEEEPYCEECGIDLIDENKFYCNKEIHLCEDCKSKIKER